MSLIGRLIGRGAEENRDIGLTFDEWANYFNYNGLAYGLTPTTTYGRTPQGEPGSDFGSYVNTLYKQNGIVFACMATRMLLFSEARFQFQRFNNGRPGDLWGNQSLELLERPAGRNSSITTSDLLTRMIQDADLCGNWFGRRPDRQRQGSRIIPGADRIVRLRPDWVTIIAASETGDAEDAVPAGYLYHPGGVSNDSDPIPLTVDEVAHFAPIPDPECRFRGMSWLTPIVREVMGDQAASTHKLRFFENGATPNLVVTMNEKVGQEAFDRWIAKFNQNHRGVLKAHETLFLGGGADAKVVGANLDQANLEGIQAAGETRIAAAAGIPPVIVGLSKGLDSSTYSNYSQARRRLSDVTLRPLWRQAAGTLANIIDVPKGSRLWYDVRDIAFLREDESDKAQIQSTEASTVRTLVEAGYEPSSVIHAVQNNDFSLLKHTGLFSVQLQKPGSEKPAVEGANSGERRVIERADVPVDKTGRALLALLPGKEEQG